MKEETRVTLELIKLIHNYVQLYWLRSFNACVYTIIAAVIFSAYSEGWGRLKHISQGILLKKIKLLL